MNRELLKICIFGGKRRGECLATLIVRRSHLALIAFVCLASGSLLLLGRAAESTAKTYTAIELISGAARDAAVSSLAKGMESVGTGIDSIRRYEDDLRLRAESLRTVLRDLKSLKGTDSLEQEQPNERETVAEPKIDPAANPKAKLGVGGGIDHRTPVISLGGSTLERSSDAAAKKPASADMIEDFDNLLDRIKQIPIGTPADGDVSSQFGYRRSPFSGARLQLHSGIDISTEIRSAVTSTADGRVVSTGYKSSYGQTVIIDHGDGFETLYGHLSKITVKPGDHVCRGEVIGQVGMTGHTTGPHVHYEIRIDGIARNPRSFIELADILKLI